MKIRIVLSLIVIPCLLGASSANPQAVRIGSQFAGFIQPFIETGLYGLKTTSKGMSILFASPLCSQCRPTGLYSTVNLDGYLVKTPFWVGVHDLGGGFGLHRHSEHQNNTATGSADSLRHVEIARESIVALLAEPTFLFGASFDGVVGGIDACVGVVPFSLQMNGGLIKTVHEQMYLKLYGYSPTLAYKIINMRLFAGAKAGFFMDSRNAEWGVTVSPGQFVQGLAGVQGGIGILKFGVAGGLKALSAGQATMNAVYNQRLEEYYKHGGTVSQPLAVDEGMMGRFVCSYVGINWKSLVLGLVNCVDLPERSKGVRTKSSFSVTLGFIF